MNCQVTTWEEAVKRAREIVWGPDAVFIVATLLVTKEQVKA